MASRFHQVFDSEITGTLGSAGRSAAEAMQIERPAPGSVQIADVQRALAIKFGFDLADVKIMAVDVDLVLVFPDGGRLVLPGLALSLLSAEPPQIAFNEEAIEPHEFISRLGDVKLIDQVPALSLASVEAEKPAEAQAESQARGQGPGSSDTAPVPSGVGTAQGAQEGRADADFPERLTSRPLIEVPRPLTRAVPEASPGKSNSGQYDEPPGDVVNKAQISFRLLGVTDTPPIGAEGDAWVFTNSFAAVPAERDPSLAAQTRGTRLLGTERDDILNAADFSRVAPGQSMRRVELSAIAIGREDEVASMIRVILPRGLRIEGVEPQGSYYEFATNGQNSIAFNLTYDLPGADIALGANGYFGTVKAMIVEMQYGADFYTGKQHFVIAPRSGEGALEMQLDATTQAAILWSNPPDTEIFAGAGHDTIRASASADMIDGGAGIDIVSYSQSHFGVEASLATGGTKAYALGDTYRNVEGLEGSAFADHLIGDANDNILIGRRGADTLDGAGGRDLADYSASNSAIIVNLNADSQLGGDAHGDVLIAIEDVRATQFRDELIGNEFANRLWGEGGNDLIQGGAGHDTLDGGLGTDTLDYSDLGVADSVSVTLHSDNSTQAFVTRQGQSEIDHITGFENVIGGQGNDTLIGSVRANLLRGGAGDDWLSGQGGPDTLDGGEGFDTASFAALSASQSVLIALNDQGHGTAEIRDAQQALIETHQLIAIEAIEGGAGDDQIIGNQHANRLSGGLGADLLQGGGGADTLDGGLGLDTLEGGAGDDLYHVADDHDLIIEHDHEGQDSARLTANFVGASYVLAQHVETLDASSVQQSLTLTGNDSANLILGGAGNDTLTGGLNADTLRGGAGDDVYVIESAQDVMIEVANEGQDSVLLQTGFNSNAFQLADHIETLDASDLQQGMVLTGNAQNNLIIGTLSHDTLIGHEGIDTLRGGAGDDLYSVDHENDVIDETSAGSGGTDTIRLTGQQISSFSIAATIAGVTSGRGNIEILDASLLTQNLTLNGNSLANRLTGGSGNDSITDSNGNDTLNGGLGNDTLNAGGGFDRYQFDWSAQIGQGWGQDVIFFYEPADDRIEIRNIGFAATSADALELVIITNVSFGVTRITLKSALAFGDVQTITLNHRAGKENIAVTATDFLFVRDPNLDWIEGTSSANTLSGTDGNDTILGLAGNDLIEASLGADFIDGGTGLDTLSYAGFLSAIVVNLQNATAQLVAPDVSHHIMGIERIIGSNFGDLIQGGAQDDIILGGLGHDTLIGGAGFDTLDYSYLTTALTINLAENGAQQTIIAAAGIDEDVVREFEHIIGGSGHDSLTGNSNNNNLTGGVGNDTLNGGAGADTMRGGAGNDVYYVDHMSDVIDETSSGSGGTDLVFTSVNYTLSSNVENLSVLGEAGLVLGGNSSANSIVGGIGNDTMSGGSGNDTLDGGAGQDTLNYSYLTTALTLALSANGAQQTVTAVAGSDVDVIRNFENIMSGSGHDVLTGNASANLIDGGAGNDSILGGLGDDILIGGAGNDTLDGGDGSDTVDYSQVTASLNFALVQGQTTTVQIGAETDQIINIENIWFGLGNDTVFGSGLANILQGNAGNDSIWGMNGNDTISGGLGNDTLNGNDGIDTIDYSYLTTGLTLVLAAAGAQQTVTAAVGDVDVISNFENVTGGSGHDSITGNSGNNIINGGGAGIDRLNGGGGDDSLGLHYQQLTNGSFVDGGAGIDQFNFSTLSASTQYSVTMTQLDQLLDNVEELHFGWSNNRISLSVDLTAGSADRTALAGIAGGNAVKIIYNDVNSAVQHQDQISVSNAVASDTSGTAGTSGYTQNFYADAGKTQLLLQLIAA